MPRYVPLLVLTLLVALGPTLVPYDPADQFRDAAGARPSRIRLGGPLGICVDQTALDDRPPGGPDCAPLKWLVPRRRAEGAWLDAQDGLALFGVEAPAHVFLFGTDDVGRDLFSRFVAGARGSLGVGLAATGLTLVLATLVGLAAGFGTARIDAALMRLCEAALTIPWVYALIAARSALPLRLSTSATLLALVGIIGVLGWARPARLVRATALTLRRADFVAAARAGGATCWRLIARHVTPHLSGVLAAQATVLLPRAVLAEVTLSFLGFGVAEPAPSWGSLIAGSQRAVAAGARWWTLLPVVAMVPLFWSLTMLADAWRADPESRLS
ncbi:MAG: ABC transporter permease [Vicinamibacterales bacterium]